MRKPLTPMGQTPEGPVDPELCILVDGKLFGLFFVKLNEAQAAARGLLTHAKRVEIFERKSGKTVERMAADAS